MKKALIIVDASYDFASSTGSLYVPNGETAVSKIIDFINLNKDDIDVVIFTLDHHPLNHCSFKSNGGIWPNHCVQGTKGAEILPQLIGACKVNGLRYKFLKKGEKTDVWEYTAFHRSRRLGNVTILKSETDAVIVNSEKFIVCGFAGDYCVKDSIVDLIDTVGAENIEVFSDGVASIDDGTIFNDFILEKKLTVVDINNKAVSKHYTLSELGLPKTIYMVANIKAFKSRVIPLTLSDCVYNLNDVFTCLCENSDESYVTSIDAKGLMQKKHERKNGFGEGRYRYFSSEENAKTYMIEHSWI